MDEEVTGDEFGRPEEGVRTRTYLPEGTAVIATGVFVVDQYGRLQWTDTLTEDGVFLQNVEDPKVLEKLFEVDLTPFDTLLAFDQDNGKIFLPHNDELIDFEYSYGDTKSTTIRLPENIEELGLN